MESLIPINDASDPQAQMSISVEEIRWPKLISALSIGSAIATVCGVLAWLTFSALTMMMRPGLTGEAYWAVVRQRAVASPVTTGVAIFFALGSAASIALIVISIVRFQKSRTMNVEQHDQQ
jgi:ABC-type Fe3+-siderophore transport system permease subunit